MGRLGGLFGRLGALVGRLGGVLGPLGRFLGRLGGLMGRLRCVVSLWSLSWARLQEPLGPSWAALGPSGGSLGPPWAALGPSGGPLGPSWVRRGGLLGRLGAVLGGSWAVLERRKAEKAKMPKTSKKPMEINDFGFVGPSLEGSWRSLGASWRSLRAF